MSKVALPFYLFSLVQALPNSALPTFIITKFESLQRGKALAISYNMSLTLFGGLMPYLILTHDTYINPGVPITICAIITTIGAHLHGRS